MRPNFIQMLHLYTTKNSPFQINVYIKTKKKEEKTPREHLWEKWKPQESEIKKNGTEKQKFTPKLKIVEFSWQLPLEFLNYTILRPWQMLQF